MVKTALLMVFVLQLPFMLFIQEKSLIMNRVNNLRQRHYKIKKLTDYFQVIFYSRIHAKKIKFETASPWKSSRLHVFKLPNQQVHFWYAWSLGSALINNFATLVCPLSGKYPKEPHRTWHLNYSLYCQSFLPALLVL